MSTITIPTFAGKTSLFATDVDAAFKAIADALAGGIDDTNLAAASNLAPAQLVEQNSLGSLDFVLDNQALLQIGGVAPDAVSRGFNFLMADDTVLVGWRLARSKIPGGTNCKIRFGFWLQAMQSSDATWSFEHTWDDANGDDGSPSDLGQQHFAFNYLGLACIPKGQYLMAALYIDSGGAQVPFVTGQLTFKRLHSKG